MPTAKSERRPAEKSALLRKESLASSSLAAPENRRSSSKLRCGVPPYSSRPRRSCWGQVHVVPAAIRSIAFVLNHRRSLSLSFKDYPHRTSRKRTVLERKNHGCVVPLARSSFLWAITFPRLLPSIAAASCAARLLVPAVQEHRQSKSSVAAVEVPYE